jgi:hypothetical protein
MHYLYCNACDGSYMVALRKVAIISLQLSEISKGEPYTCSLTYNYTKLVNEISAVHKVYILRII